MPVLEFKDTAQLIAKFDELKASGEFFIAYFTGGIDANNYCWCPDCDDARPNIKKHILEKTELTVLKGVVDDRNSWVGVADHPYKVHPVMKAGGVPSLVLLQGEMALMRAESPEDFNNEELLGQIANPN